MSFFLKLLYNMYSNTQFSIKKNNSLGDMINSYRGVKKGDGLK